MPADFSALIDTLLVLAGLVLVATGLVMFIYSKTSTQASSVEAFGIKLNVTHPSLILVLAGVGLMLAPRLLPEPGGKPGHSETAVVAPPATPQAELPAGTAAAPPAATPAQPPAVETATPTEPAPPRAAAPPSPPPSGATAAAAVAPDKPAAKPAPVVAVRPPPAAKPRVTVRDARTAKPPAATTPATPLARTAPAVARPEAASPPTTTAMATPPPAAKPARPTLLYAALALPSHHRFWSGETQASYTRRMRSALQQAGGDVARMDARGLELGQREFDALWNESRQHPRSRELCAQPDAPRALLSARVETPTTISSVESAFWPELSLRLFVCANARVYRQNKSLSPQNDDAWPFATELNAEVERFLRAYRNELADS